MRKNYYQKLAFLGMLLVVLYGFQKYTSSSDDQIPNVKFVSENKELIPLYEFNPNDLDENQWSKLGFTEKEIATILNYKKVVGGNFVSKKQLKKCYAITPEKFAQLESYILLPEDNKDAKSNTNSFSKFAKKELKINGKFNPDVLSESDWQAMGFSDKQAAAIIKYRNYLGGSFVSKEKFKECFIINDENYRKLAPYLQLPEKKPSNFNSYQAQNKTVKTGIQHSNFDPNIYQLQDWMKLGFSEKQAQAIVNYRDRNLKGSFKTLDDIKKCFVISEQKFEEIKPYVQLNPATMFQTNTPNKTIAKQEQTDFSKTDLNTITFKQLIEFGFDERAAGSMVGFRKKLGGFATKNQILDTYNIDKELMQKLLAIAPLDASKVEKYTLVDAPEEWLKNHPYFKYSADKIIYLRVSYPNDQKIWKNLKVKPDYEAKMRLYLK